MLCGQVHAFLWKYFKQSGKTKVRMFFGAKYIHTYIYIYAHIYVYVYTCRHFYLFGVKIPYISFMKWCLVVNLMLEYFYCLIYYRKNATPRNCKSGIMEWIGNYNWQMCHDKGAGIMDKHRNSVLMSDLATSKRSALGFLWKEWC